MTRDSRFTLAPVSSTLLAWDLQDGVAFEASTGLLAARSGQRGTWSRGGVASAAGILTSNGSYTAPASLPSYEARTINGVSQTTLNMDANASVVFPCGFAPQILTGYLSFIELGARTTVNSTLFAVSGDDPTTGVRLYIDTTGTYYRITYHNGTTSVTATLASGTPASGDHVALWWVWTASGLTLKQSINGAAATTAFSGALALPSAWAVGSKIRLNRRGLTQNPASGAYGKLVLAPGSLSDAGIVEVW
jgi:hypothetical protein